MQSKCASIIVHVGIFHFLQTKTGSVEGISKCRLTCTPKDILIGAGVSFSFFAPTENPILIPDCFMGSCDTLGTAGLECTVLSEEFIFMEIFPGSFHDFALSVDVSDSDRRAGSVFLRYGSCGVS